MTIPGAVSFCHAAGPAGPSESCTPAVGGQALRTLTESSPQISHPRARARTAGAAVPQSIQGYLTGLLQKDLSSTTVRYHAVILHEAYGHAVKWGLVGQNPVDQVQIPRKLHVEMRVWDEEQVKLFLAEAKRSSPYYALYLAALTTGMRQGELLGLRWQDVNLAIGEARITQTFYPLGRRPIFKAPKTNRSRRGVALPAALVKAPTKKSQARSRIKREAGDAYQDLGLVFCQTDGKPLHAQNIIRRNFEPTIRRANVPRIRFHDLRNCYALLLQQGVHPKDHSGTPRARHAGVYAARLQPRAARNAARCGRQVT